MVGSKRLVRLCHNVLRSMFMIIGVFFGVL